MKPKHRILSAGLILCLMCSLVLTACGDKKDEFAASELYQVYYKSANNNTLTSTTVGSHMSSLDNIVSDLLAQMQIQIPNDPDLVPAIPQSLTILNSDCSLKPYVLVNFSKDYNKLDKLDELLCRAAVTMTLTQLDEVEYVEIEVNGKKLTGSDGAPVGPLSAQNFLTDANGRLAKEKNDMILYYAEAEGKRLIATDKTVLTETETPKERLILQMLSEDPGNEGLRSLISPDVKVLNTSIENGICYVNFSKEFIQQPENLKPDLIIFGIVNSLCEVPEISSVQFLVEGESDIKYAGDISLAEPLSRDGSYVLTTD